VTAARRGPEHIERINIDEADISSSRSVSRRSTILFALLPHVLHQLVDITLYRWATASSLFNYREASALLIVVPALVSAIDFISYQRRRLHLANS
jgi:ABC-type phosphate/phosphonate transport system permease subunit